MEVRDRKARKVSQSLFEALGPGAYERHVLRGSRMVSQGSTTSPARLPTGVLSAPVVDDRLRQRASNAVAPTDVASGAAVIISAGNITHATTSATGPTDGRVNNHVVATRPWPDTTTRHRHALSPHLPLIRPSCRLIDGG